MGHDRSDDDNDRSSHMREASAAQQEPTRGSLDAPKEAIADRMARDGLSPDARNDKQTDTAHNFGETPAAAAVALPPIMTVDELAVFLRLNRKSVYAAIRAKQIPGARHIGGTIRIHRDTVLAWLAAEVDRVRVRR